MSKIIIHASSFRKNYNIETISITASEYKNAKAFELEAKPEPGFIVDAADFYSGYLYEVIQSVSYSNTKDEVDFENKVLISVVLKENISISERNNVVVLIPVNGIGKVVSNELTFTDETVVEENINVYDRLNGEVKRVSSSALNNVSSNTYVVRGKNGESGIIMQKIFEATHGYALSPPPDWKLRSRTKSNYTITTKEFRDKDSNLVRKVYEISYLFPKNKFTAKYNDKITFI
jgi:hypothetical protein